MQRMTLISRGTPRQRARNVGDGEVGEYRLGAVERVRLNQAEQVEDSSKHFGSLIV